MILLNLKAKLIAAGAALLAILAAFFRIKMLKDQRDKAKQTAEALKNRNQLLVEERKIIKEKEKEVASTEATLKQEEKKVDEEFKGASNLSNSSKWVR